MKQLLVMASFLTIFSHSALADGKYTYNLGLGASIALGTEHVKNATDVGPLFRLGVYRYTSKRMAFGLDYDYLDFSDDTDLNDHSFTINARYHFTPFYKRFLPFAKLGTGFAFVRDMPGITDDSTIAFTVKTGIGFDMAIDTHWALGLEVDYHYIAKKDRAFTEQHLLAPMLNITYAPGKNKKNFYYKQHKFTTWAEGDEDADGVSEFFRIVGVSVETSRCNSYI